MQIDFNKYKSRVEKGYRKMSNSKIVICALVRDSEKALIKNIPFIEQLASKFLEAKIFIVENDSKDNTKSLLNDWAKSNLNVIIDSRDYGSKTIEKELKYENPKAKYFSRNRISKMANYRNIYMNYVRNSLNIEYLIAIDLDVYSIDLDGIANSFGFEKKWDSINSNGRKVTPQSPFKPTFYDTFAFQDINDEGPTSINSIKKYQVKYKQLKKGMELIKVNSGFNGMAIYNWNSIKNLTYKTERNEDEIVQFSCEHTTFHKEMRENGYDAIFLNPSQVLEYEKLSPKLYINKLKNKLRS